MTVMNTESHVSRHDCIKWGVNSYQFYALLFQNILTCIILYCNQYVYYNYTVSLATSIQLSSL